MSFSLAKRFALAGVARGIRIPENQVNRYQELLHLTTLLKELKITCVLDVGANTGQFARELRSSGFDGFIMSFEPVELAYRALCAEFEGDARWRGYKLALGDEDARMTINVTPEMTVMSSFLAPRNEALAVEEEEVDVRRLDGIFGEVVASVPGPRVFLKMDTQGFDLKVFEGVTGCAESILGLQSELSVVPIYEGMPTYIEALSVYRDAGFQLFNLTAVTRGDADELLEMNCFMKRNEAPGV